jgi:hypothetical protein
MIRSRRVPLCAGYNFLLQTLKIDHIGASAADYWQLSLVTDFFSSDLLSIVHIHRGPASPAPAFA